MHVMVWMLVIPVSLRWVIARKKRKWPALVQERADYVHGLGRDPFLTATKDRPPKGGGLSAYCGPG